MRSEFKSHFECDPNDGLLERKNVWEADEKSKNEELKLKKRMKIVK